jgi:lipoprotein Spr
MAAVHKIFITVVVVPGIILSGCGASKSLTSSTGNKSQGKEQQTVKTEGKSTKPSQNKTAKGETAPVSKDTKAPAASFNNTFTIDRAISVQFRYSILMNTEVETLSNTALYNFIDNWWGTPYRIGGMTQRGVDCSAFVQNLNAAIFNIALPRTSKEQYDASHRIPIKEVCEGDLLFFSTKGKISHVGVYLQNNKFVHASTSSGVTISDLSEPYWSKRFSSAARPDTSLAIGR